MSPKQRLAARVLPASLAALSLAAFAGSASAASPTSYGAEKANGTVPVTSVDLEISPGPSAGGGSGRRVH